MHRKRYKFKSAPQMMSLFIMVALASKVIEKNYLIKKFGSDRETIMLNAIRGTKSDDGAYGVTEAFFSILIKLFKINTVQAWAYALGIIGTIAALCWIWHFKEQLLYLNQAIFFAMSLGLLNLYVFSVSKEIYQMLLSLPMYWILFNKQCTKKQKWLAIVVTLGIIALTFRTYYIIILCLFMAIWMIFYRHKVPNKQRWLYFLSFIVVLGFGLWMAQKLMPDLYFQVVNIREGDDPKRANTIIRNLFDSKDPIGYLINWGINVIRLLFPIELVTKGAFQIISFIYLAWLGTKLVGTFFKSLSDEYKLNFDLHLWCCLLVAFVMGSAIFEPDFGSWLRHQLVMYPLFQMLMLQTSDKEARLYALAYNTI